MVAEGSHIGLANLPEITAESEGDVVEAEHMLAMSIATMIMLNVISLAVGQWLHSKHIYWLPECGATIIIGFFAGWVVSATLPPNVERRETNLYFDPVFFTLFLLPPIIFEAGYSLHMPVFSRNVGKILTLAVVGTLVSTAITWYALYTDHTDMLIDLSFSESGQFAALISAVDPVATLSLFSALKVDPSLNNLVVGESVLNDAVALITFRAITHYGVNLKNEVESIILSFVMAGLGSAAIGSIVGGIAALSFKVMGMGRRGDLPHIECTIFIAFAYFSFICAELPENSGIVSALFAGMTMRAFASPNLSPRSRLYVEVVLKVMTTICDNIIYLLVGFALTVEVPYVLRPDLPGTTLLLSQSSSAFIFTLIVCIVARAVHLFPILSLFNACNGKDQQVPISQMIVCWFSGLRGAIAVALAYQVTGPNAHVIRAATMFVVVGTTFLFGGSTKCLLDVLKIPTNCEDDAAEGDAISKDADRKAGWRGLRSVFVFFREVLVDHNEEAFQELGPPRGGSGAHEA